MKRKNETTRRLYLSIIIILLVGVFIALSIALNRQYAFVDANATLQAEQTRISMVGTEAALNSQMTTAAEQTRTSQLATQVAATAQAEQLTRDSMLRNAAELQSRLLADAAEEAVANDDPQLALGLIVEASTMDNPPASVQRTFADIAYAPHLRHYFQTSRQVYDLAFHPSGEWVLIGTIDELIWWHVTSDEKIINTDHDSLIKGVAFSADGRFAASADYDGVLIVWDAASRTELWRGELRSFNSVAFSPDGILVATGGGDLNLGQVAIWDVASGEIVGSIGEPSDLVFDVTFSPDGTQLLTGAGYHTGMNLWDVETGEQLVHYDTPTGMHVLEVAFSPDAGLVAGALSGEVAMVWHTITAERVHRLRPSNANSIGSVEFSADGTRLVTGDWNGSMVVWDVANGQEIQHVLSHEQNEHVRFSPDGKQLVAGGGTVAGQGGDVYLLDLTSTGLLQDIDVDTDYYFDSAAFTPDRRYLISQGEESDDIQQVRLLDARTGAVQYSINVAGTFYSLSPDGSHYLVGRADIGVQLRDTITGELIRTFDAKTDRINGAVMNDDIVTIAETDYWLRFLDAHTGEVIYEIEHDNYVTNLGLSNNGVWVAVAVRGRGVIVYDLNGFGIVQELRGATTSLETLVFSHDDGQLLLVDNQGFEIWDIATGEQILERIVSGEDYYSVTNGIWHPSGEAIIFASSGEETEISIWDIQRNQMIRQYTDVGDGYIILGFTDDSTLLAAFSNATYYPGNRVDYRIRLTEHTLHRNDELLAWVADNRYVREFTCDERLEYNILPLCE